MQLWRKDHISHPSPECSSTVLTRGSQEGAAGILLDLKMERSVLEPPCNLKMLSLATVYHKLHLWREIADLLFDLAINRWDILSVKSTSKVLAPLEVLDHMGEALSRLITAVEAAPEIEEGLVFSKIYIKDSYWHMSSE